MREPELKFLCNGISRPTVSNKIVLSVADCRNSNNSRPWKSASCVVKLLSSLLFLLWKPSCDVTLAVCGSRLTNPEHQSLWVAYSYTVGQNRTCDPFSLFKRLNLRKEANSDFMTSSDSLESPCWPYSRRKAQYSSPKYSTIASKCHLHLWG